MAAFVASFNLCVRCQHCVAQSKPVEPQSSVRESAEHIAPINCSKKAAVSFNDMRAGAIKACVWNGDVHLWC